MMETMSAEAATSPASSFWYSTISRPQSPRAHQQGEILDDIEGFYSRRRLYASRDSMRAGEHERKLAAVQESVIC
jgi:hypothetical protein